MDDQVSKQIKLNILCLYFDMCWLLLQNILYVADVSEFFAEEASVYLVYVQNQSEFNR